MVELANSAISCKSSRQRTLTKGLISRSYERIAGKERHKAHGNVGCAAEPPQESHRLSSKHSDRDAIVKIEHRELERP